MGVSGGGVGSKKKKKKNTGPGWPGHRRATTQNNPCCATPQSYQGGLGEAQGLVLCAIVSLDQNVRLEAVGSLGGPRHLVVWVRRTKQRDKKKKAKKPIDLARFAHRS